MSDILTQVLGKVHTHLDEGEGKPKSSLLQNNLIRAVEITIRQDRRIGRLVFSRMQGQN